MVKKFFLKAKENFFKEMKNQGKVKVLGEYLGVHELIEAQCLKDKKHRWKTTPHKILKKGVHIVLIRLLKKVLIV